MRKKKTGWLICLVQNKESNMAKSNNKDALAIVGIQKDIEYLKAGQNRIEATIIDIQEHYLTKEDFVSQMTPIQRFVYGLIALVLTAVFGAGITLVLKK